MAKNGAEVLLVGDVSRVVLDSNIAAKLPLRLCADIDQAITLAADGDFKTIALTISSLQGDAIAKLEVLRRTNRKSRIYLLAQMYEEPIALELVHCGFNGDRLVDDYFICPVKIEKFLAPAKTEDKPKTPERTQVDDDGSKDEVIAELSRLATVDDLTGAKNRRYVREFLHQIIERSKAWNLNVTLLLFDIDNFKHYNDVYGHLVGDTILKQAVVLMRSCCRAHDVVGRIGGDEFVVVFWDRSQAQHEAKQKDDSAPAAGLEQERRSTHGIHPQEAIFVAERFRKELSSAKFPLLGPEGKGVLTISGALASFPRDGDGVEQLFAQADAGLLEAKRSGKNRIYLVGKSQNHDE